MKIISKRISRNEFVSRKNGVIPSLVDMWMIPETQLNCGGSESFVFGTYESAAAKIRELGLSPSLLEYKAEFVYQDHNYGLIVSDIIIPDSIASNITDYTDIYVNIPDGSGEYYDLNNPSSSYHYEGRKIMHDGKEVKILTYTTLNKWYTFFKNYKQTIKIYDNAIGLYDAECEVKNEYNRKKYSDLDDLFNARGGDTMYDWIIENCMPHENDYDDDETNDLQVKETFDYATNSASYVIPILITNSIDDLGEMTMFSSKWEAGVDYHNRVSEGKGTVVDRPYYRGSSSEDIYSCSKNNEEFDIDTNFDDDSLKTSYETYVIKDNVSKGYKQNEYYENEFNGSDWYNYTDWYISENKSEFASYTGSTCVSTYAYSHSGKVLYNPTSDCETIDYTEKDFILSDGESIDVVDGYYTVPSYTNSCVANVKLKKGIKIPVKTNGALKYAELNGKKFYALKDKNGEEKIYFLKESNCYDAGSPIIQSKYIIYNGNVFPFKGSNVIIETDEGTYNYCIFNGYFWYNGILFYVLGKKVGLPVTNVKYNDDDTFVTRISFKELDSDSLSKLGWESVSVSDGKVTICHKLDIKHADIISGYTDSKLDLLRRRKINTDELGNELPGYFDLAISSEDEGIDITTNSETRSIECDVDTQFAIFDKVKVEGKTYNSPYDQCTLDILYKVGEVSGIDYQKNTHDELLFIGNYLESIEFYQLDDKGGKINQTSVECEDSRPYLELYCKEPGSGEEVVYCNGEEIGNVGKYYDPEKVLYCDITYYIGATLVFDENTSKYKMADKRHKGVKYVDTLTVTKTTGDFYMSDNSFFTFIYYELRGNMSGQYLDDFRDNQLTNMSYFEMDIMLFCNTERCKENDKEFCTDYWENNNGMIATPVFRTEYNLFSSTPQNVDSDIYIDRGINAAFEKHIKLQEVHTLEALENYGNGYFKINEY